MPAERWKGFIKDYDGGTFMECKIHPKIDYDNISNIIKNQKQYVIDQIKKLCINNIRFKGIDANKLINQKNRHEDKPLIDLKNIPGIVEGGWVEDDYIVLEKQKERCFNLTCQNIIDTFKRHKSAWPFNEPVNKEDVPDYYEKIKEPMDIKTIEKKLQNN